MLWSGNHIGHHSKISDNCFLSSHVVISGNTQVGKNCFIGVNSTVINRIKIDSDCFITANSFVKQNIPENTIVKGEKLIIGKAKKFAGAK